MRYLFRLACTISAILSLCGCASQIKVPDTLLRGPQAEEVLPPSTRVHIDLRSGDDLRARVRSVNDSTLVLAREPHQMIGHPDSIVVAIDDIETLRILGTNPARYLTSGFALTAVGVIFVFSLIFWGMDDWM